MKKKLLLIVIIPLLLSGCNSCGKPDPKYKTMTRYGGWQARIDESRKHVSACDEKLADMRKYEFDSIDYRTFSSPYPYWKTILVYMDDGGLQKAKLLSHPEKGNRTEELYFKDNLLIYASLDPEGLIRKEADSSRGQEYFFVENQLVLALDEKGERRDITDDTVLITGVDLLQESKDIKKIIAHKQLKL